MGKVIMFKTRKQLEAEKSKKAETTGRNLYGQNNWQSDGNFKRYLLSYYYEHQKNDNGFKLDI